MGVATGIAAGVGLLGSGFQAIKGQQQAKAAQRELENYQRQELRSPYEDVQVSTMGADLQREEQARLAASQVESLQGAGVRGLVGGLGRVEAGSQLMNAQIGADLDQQQQQISMALAQDRGTIRGMQEQREMQDIGALSSQYNSGNQMFWSGLGGMAQSGLSVLPSLDGESLTPEQRQARFDTRQANRQARFNTRQSNKNVG